MSLTRAQVQFLANTEPFRSRLAEVVQRIVAIWGALPVDVRRDLWNMRQDRIRSRTVSRRKQRRSW
jgi:hypothetical protein